MAGVKPLSAKQLAVIDDIFEGELKDSQILINHNLSRKLFEKWLTDRSFNDQLNRRKAWEHRRNEILLYRCVREAVTNLMKLTKSQQPETARKACLDIITMGANLSDGKQTSDDKSKQTPEYLPFSTETNGKILALIAEEKSNENATVMG